MNLRQKIARAEVEEEAGEKRELIGKKPRRDVQHTRAKRAQDRRDCVDAEERAGAPAAITRGQHEGHGVQSVGEVVGDHREQDDQADLSSGLETDADGKAIEKAVKRETEGAGQ